MKTSKNHSRLAIFSLALLMLALPLISAEALLVTLSYNSGSLAIKHVEMIAGEAANPSDDGPLILAYQTPSGMVGITKFSMPILELGESGPYVLDNAEFTTTIPVQAGATKLVAFKENGDVAAEFSLEGISKAGDAKGEPPSESMAAATGESSVSAAVQKAQSGSSAGSDIGANPAGSGANKGAGKGAGSSSPSGSQAGLCGPAVLLSLGIAAFALLRQ